MGGENLNDFNRVHWLDAVALVGQEPVLFAGSVVSSRSTLPHTIVSSPSIIALHSNNSLLVLFIFVSHAL